jgi:membrane protease subunit HflK
MSNQDQQPPWGRRKKPQTPEEIVAQIIKKVQDYFSEGKKPPPGGSNGDDPQPPGKNPFGGTWKIILIAIVGIVVLSGISKTFFKINPQEEGVVLRFGEYNRTVQPGLHFMVPFIEDVRKVDVRQIRKQEFGFRTAGATGQRTSFDNRGYNEESLMLTADKNVISVSWIVQYRIKDSFNYLFKIQDVEQAVHDLNETVTRRVVGNMDFDFVLSNRDLLANLVKTELQDQLNNLEAGLELVTVQFQDITPPDPVKPAFNEVNEADQDMKRLVNEAEQEYNRVIPAARGRAERIIEEAFGYARERVNNAEGETIRFLDILEEYRNAPDVTRKRFYLETMQDKLPEVEQIYIIDEEHQGPLPLLNLNKTPVSAGTGQQ